jgi:hypothetical protein
VDPTATDPDELTLPLELHAAIRFVASFPRAREDLAKQ